jgi:hypothetical protein
MVRLILRFQLLTGVAALLATQAAAVTIDDFSQGPFSETGGSNLISQADLDPNHVAGGRRDFRFGAFDPPDTLAIDPGFGALSFSTGSNSGYMTLMYGMGGPLGLDFTVDGHDRLRFRFSNVVASPTFSMWLSINTPLPPMSSSPMSLDTGLVALNGGGGVLEVPFDSLPADYSNVSTLAVDLGRFPAGAGFVLEEIVTAGPPLPGDFNRDGHVNADDYDEWRGRFGTSLFGAIRLGPDGNGDGRIDAADYTVWRDNLGAASATGGSAAAVPEPASIVLMIVALLGILKRSAIG